MWSTVTKGTCRVGGVIKNSSLVPSQCINRLSSTSLLASLTTDSSSSSAAVAAAESTTTTRTAQHQRTLQPLVVCGPSGVGKGTIISRFMEIVNDKKKDSSDDSSISINRLPHNLPEFNFSVSHTTRLPRSGEIHGVHYHFVTKEYMLSKINNCNDNNSTDIHGNEGGKNNNFFVEYAQVHGNLYGTSYQSIYDASSFSSVSEEKEDAVVASNDVDQQRRQHRRECLLDIDVNGVRSIKEFQLRQRREVVKMVVSPTSKNHIRLGKERSTQQYIIQRPNTIHPASSNDRSSSSGSSNAQPQLPLLDPKYVFITPPNIETLRERLSNRNTETPESLELRLRNAQEEMEYGMTNGNFDAIVVNDDLERACEEFVQVVEKLYRK